MQAAMDRRTKAATTRTPEPVTTMNIEAEWRTTKHLQTDKLA